MHIRRPPQPAYVAVFAVLGGLVAAFVTAQILLFSLGILGLLAGSMIGASVVSTIYPQRSTAVAIAYTVPGTIGFVLLPLAMAAMSDGHPGHVMYWEFLTLAHVALSLMTLHFVRRISNPRVRMAIPIVVIGCTGALGFGLSIAGKRHAANLQKQTQDNVGPAFERDILPHILATPERIEWSAPAIEEKQYSITGKLPSRSGVVQITGRDPYNIWFTVTLDAGLFEMGDQKDLPGRLKRAKIWLKESGVAKEIFESKLNVYSPGRWELDTMGLGRASYVTAGDRKITLGGLASFDPDRGIFRG